MFAIDVNTLFGTSPTQLTDFSLSTLTKLMESHGIAAALTLSLRGVHDDHSAGNDETLAACRANPRLIPVATINPLRRFGLQEDVEAIRAGGFRAVRFFAGDVCQDWPVDAYSFRRVLEHLAPLGLPILAPARGNTQIASLARTTAEVGLPLVLLGTSYSTQSEVAEVANRFPHIYVDTSSQNAPNAIAVLAEDVGVDRILYGSRMPQLPPQASMNAIFRAELSDQQRRQILYGNALRLFRLAEGAVQPVNERARFRGYRGPIIDVHAHLHSGKWWFPIKAAGPHVVLEQCRRHKVERAIASSLLAIDYDMEAGNREMKAMIDGHPELLGYVVVNPNFLDRSCAQLDHYYLFDNFVGAKIHCQYSNQPATGRPIRALMAEIARRGRPVKLHCDEPNNWAWAEAIREMALAHPNLPIIIAHGGPRGTARLIADAPNVCLEFARSSMGIIQEAVATIGPERVLFGTDQDLYDVCFYLGVYHDAGLTAREEEMIMYTNAKRLFGLTH